MLSRAIEASLQEFGEFLLRGRLVRPTASPYCVRWVRQFLGRSASDGALADEVRDYFEWVESDPWHQEWQVHQAEHALRLYFVNFLQRQDWERAQGAAVDSDSRVGPLAALDSMRRRIRTRHYSYRTETSYMDWGRRFLAYLSDRQGASEPRVDTAGVQDVLTHLALVRGVSASSQNQALPPCCFSVARSFFSK